MNIMFAAAECVPFSSQGGLGDYIRSLSAEIARRGHHVTTVIPWTRAAALTKPKIHQKIQRTFDFEGRSERYVVGFSRLGARHDVALVRHTTYTNDLYGGATDEYGSREQYSRARFFCRALLDLIASGVLLPDVVHAHDAFVGLLPEMLRDGLVKKRPKVLFSIHNGRYQGAYVEPHQTYADSVESPLPRLASPQARFVNAMQRGAFHADATATVSPSYARELLDTAREHPRHDGLAGFLKRHKIRPIGILSGIDVERYNPARSPGLLKHFTHQSLQVRPANKAGLQRMLGLAEDQDSALVVMVTRVDIEQKGIDLVLEVASNLKDLGAQLAITAGNGRWLDIDKRHSKHLALAPFSFKTESLFYAGGDFLLMPSRFEPCGLSQMKAMRFGCVPIVRSTGGLADTVTDYDETSAKGTGFVFRDMSREGLLRAIVRALGTFARPREMSTLRRRVMRIDNSWKRSAKTYLDLYDKLVRS